MRTQTLLNQRVRVYGHEITISYVGFRFEQHAATATDEAEIEVHDFDYDEDEALSNLLHAYIDAAPDRRSIGIPESPREKILAAITEAVSELQSELSVIDSGPDDFYDDEGRDDGN